MKKIVKRSSKPLDGLKILFADDESSIREVMHLELERMGHEATICPDGLAAVAALEHNSYDCVLVDLDMPGLSGIQVIERAKELTPEIEAVVLTGKSSLDTAVAALRQGAFDYLTKPCKLVELESLLSRIAQKRELTNQYRALKQRLARIEGNMNLAGSNESMERVRQLIAKVAPTHSTVLILGETGTGKELVARAIHRRSRRAARAMIKANLAAVPDTLVASELFGHEKGAFTGALQRHIGRFELASGGTLFLDEVGELPPDMQVALLRVLQEGEFERVGGSITLKSDARVVGATNRDLAADVETGRFRSDLYYRLNVFPIHVPPLRERREDIPMLLEYFAARHGARLGKRFRDVKRSVLSALAAYDWPGNIRELGNTVERAAILSEDDTLRFDGFPWDARAGARPAARSGRVALPSDSAEREAIERALAASRGRVSGASGAAAKLGIPASTIESRIKRLRIDKFRYKQR